MFLVQSQVADGRVFYAYITGHEARLTKRWVSITDSAPNYLVFQGLPTMSFDPPNAINFTAAKWTTSKVQLTKQLSNNYVQLDASTSGVFADAQWVRTVLITLQDNPTYTCDGFDAQFRPTLHLANLRNRPTAYRWTTGTLVQLMPVQPYPELTPAAAIINISSDNSKDDEEDDSSMPGPPGPKRPCHGLGRTTGAA